MTIIRSRSPHRIEFCGGGTDVPEYYKKNGGFVINAAINKYSYVSLPSNPSSRILSIYVSATSISKRSSPKIRAG